MNNSGGGPTAPRFRPSTLREVREIGSTTNPDMFNVPRHTSTVPKCSSRTVQAAEAARRSSMENFLEPEGFHEQQVPSAQPLEERSI